MLNLESLTSGFRDLGVQTGDTLLVHSSYKSLGEVDGGPQTVIDALLSALGPNGTLIMPTFNFDFNQGKPWDVRKTRSKMGALTEVVRMDPRAQTCLPSLLFLCSFGQTRRDAGKSAL